MSSPTHLNRRTLLTMLGGSVATPLLAPRIARSQEAWPARTVRYVNGFPAGGATDTLSRILCQKMSELSGASFVVENRAGAGGVLGADAVAKAPPDGYTVGLGGIAQNVLAIGSYAKLPHDPRGDFTFIGPRVLLLLSLHGAGQDRKARRCRQKSTSTIQKNLALRWGSTPM